MRKEMIGCFMILCCGALVAGGCAKKELVKGEEAPAAGQPAVTAPSAPGAPSAPVKEEKVREQGVKETTAPAAAASAQQEELATVYFDFDSFILTAPARATLTKNAEAMQKNSSMKIRIEGNCDERGSDEYNLALGEKRAKAAMNYLTTLGIPADRLSIISYGKEKPADPGHDEAAWAKNRRDDFVILK